MYKCEKCKHEWDVQRYIGDPEVRQCPRCDSYEIVENTESVKHKVRVEINNKAFTTPDANWVIEVDDVMEILGDLFNKYPRMTKDGL